MSVNSLCVVETEGECETEVVAGAGLVCQVEMYRMYSMDPWGRKVDWRSVPGRNV